ncbi:DNRLRE domain-containing protein [Lysinibacillus capsici]|uniref:DNRLRE domain-containing protein n=1 Tax=Lysinibacillus capsici TaxID=2115968 RepID=UPI002480E839|nr:DNRLRE domain-containing protein [Lysinibacillus capsici]
MLRKIFIQLIVLAMFIAFIPFGNFASVAAKEQSPKKITKGKEKIEIVGERTQTSKTFNNSDGTYTTEIYEAPIHFKDNKGNWKDIDNGLQKKKNNGKGQYKNKANNFTVTFDERIDKETNNVQVADNQYNLNIGLKEIEQKGEVIPAKEVIGVATDNQIEYQNVFDNISSTYSVGENFVKEDIIINKKPEKGLPQTFSYQLSLENLTYEQINNQIYLKDAKTGEIVYVIEAPFMYDAYKPVGFQSIDGSNSIPEEAKSYDITLKTRKENNTLWIDLTPDTAWLQDTKRQYPIVIDPTIVRIQGNSKMVDTTIRKKFPTQTGGNDTELGTGTAIDGNIVRSLLKFDVTPIPEKSIIMSADVSLYLSSTNDPTPINLSMHAMKRSWDENTATWNNYATAGGWTTGGGDFNTTALSTVTGVSSVPSNVEEGIKRWSIPTSMVSGWLYNPESNLGLLLKSTSESTLIYKKFISSESTTNPLAYKPKLVVTYKTPNRLGLEDYWDYATHDISNGSNYVNLGTNNNVIQYTDFSLFNYGGFGLDFTRTYNSKDFEKSPFGYGWSFTGSEKLFYNDKYFNVEYKDADGTVHVYSWDGDKYIAPTGNYDSLVMVDKYTFKLTSKTGIITTFKVRESTSDTDIEVAYITEQKDLNSNTITYNYDTSNQLTSISTNLGTKLLLTYTDGLITNAKYNKQDITYTYTDGYLTRVLVKKDDTTSTPTSFYYTTNGQLTKIIDSKQKIMLYGYNSELDLVSVTEPSLDGQVDSITNYSLDRTNNIVTVTSPEGTVTRYGLNNNFNVTKMFDPSGDTTTYTLDEKSYNVLSQNVMYSDGSTYTKKFEYDTKGNLLSTNDSKGVTESYTYNEYSNLLTQTDANQQTTTNTYENGNLKTSTTPKGETTTYTYNDHGDLTQVKYPDGKIETYSTSYENNQKLTTYQDIELGITTKTVTDFNGNILSYEDGKKGKTRYQYNLKNELVEVEDAANKITTYTFDANSNLTSVTNANGKKQMSLSYNAQNAIEKETNAEGQVTSYNYNADGDLSEIIKAAGEKIAYTTSADTNTQIVKINGVNQFSTQVDGLSTTVTNHTLSNQKVTYTLSENELLQRVDINAPVNRSIMYTYKNEKDLESIQYGTNTIEYESDENGQTIAVTLNGQPSASFARNTNGLLESTTYKNGAVILNKYKADQLQTETLKTNSTTTWRTNAYEYDKNQQITKVTNSDGTVTYTYDALNQLTKEQYSNGLSISYTYDSVGNRTSKTTLHNGNTTTTNYSYNDANQMKAAGDKTYTVSPNGNVTNDGVFQYVWNAFDQLSEVKTLTGTTVATYRYDESGRRVYSKDSNGETYYHYNGLTNEVLFEEDANGNIKKAYTYGDNGHLLTMTYQGSTYYYLTNYRGDVLALTDSNGDIVAKYTYDAWGNIMSEIGTMATINPYRYAGYRYDENTKLYYLMARYYNSETGAFLSLDPRRGDIKNPLSLNGYSYGNNNPVMNVDPDGESAFSVIFNRFKNAILYGIGKWMSFYIPGSLFKALQNGSIAPYILFGEKILNGVINSIKAYSNGKKNLSGLVSDIKKTMAGSRSQQQKLIKSARNQIRKYSAKIAGKVLLKSIFTWADIGIIGYYTIVGYSNRYGWSRAWK